MESPALVFDEKLPLEKNDFSLKEDNDDIKRIIDNTHSEELIITLCGYIGTDIHGVSEKVKDILVSIFDYKVEIIKLSSFIEQFSDSSNQIEPGDSKYGRIKKLINGGNALRDKHGNDILGQCAIQKINYVRVADKGTESAFKTRRKCFIIDSLKNTDELLLFKKVYRDIHYSIGVFSPVEVRESILRYNFSMTEDEIRTLIDRDSGEEITYGQQVRNTFIESDYFLRLDGSVNEAIEVRLKRFLHLIFGSKVITPTVEETAMYQAASAASNSACLSRQVGAALTDMKGEILSIGWNDVPKAGGGLYQSDLKNDPVSENDERCFNKGSKGCWNDEEKNLMAEELVNTLIQEKFISEDQRQSLFLKVRNSKIKSLVEFSRAVHAEMHAIITACQTYGGRVRSGNLYITTYPCHNCARHIILAGIKKVYYIEPYRKSLTIKLHSDAITEKEGFNDKVLILMYDGVSPSKYMELFRMIPDSRKTKTGASVRIDLKSAKPKTTLSLEAIPVLESLVSKSLQKKGLKISG